MTICLLVLMLFDPADAKRGINAVWGTNTTKKIKRLRVPISICIVLVFSGLFYLKSTTESHIAQEPSVVSKVKEEKLDDSKPKKIVPKPKLKRFTETYALIEHVEQCEEYDKKGDDFKCRQAFKDGLKVYERTKTCLKQHEFVGVYVSRKAGYAPFDIPVVEIEGEMFFSNMIRYQEGIRPNRLESALVARCDISGKKKPQSATEEKEKPEVKSMNLDDSKGYTFLASKRECHNKTTIGSKTKCIDSFDFGVSIYNRTKHCLPKHSFKGVYVTHEEHNLPLEVPVVEVEGKLFFSNMKAYQEGISPLMLEDALIASCKLPKVKSDKVPKIKVNKSLSHGRSERYIRIQERNDCYDHTDKINFSQCSASWEAAMDTLAEKERCLNNRQFDSVIVVPPSWIGLAKHKNYAPPLEALIFKKDRDYTFIDGQLFTHNMNVTRELMESKLLYTCSGI